MDPILGHSRLFKTIKGTIQRPKRLDNMKFGHLSCFHYFLAKKKMKKTNKKTKKKMIMVKKKKKKTKIKRK